MLKFFIAAQNRLMTSMDDLRNSEKGQTMAEYGVVLAVIAVIVVAALTLLSTGITGALNKVTAKL